MKRTRAVRTQGKMSAVSTNLPLIECHHNVPRLPFALWLDGQGPFMPHRRSLSPFAWLPLAWPPLVSESGIPSTSSRSYATEPGNNAPQLGRTMFFCSTGKQDEQLTWARQWRKGNDYSKRIQLSPLHFLASSLPNFHRLTVNIGGLLRDDDRICCSRGHAA
jgi:hypothetical protein